jgi:hypothetical protein
VEDDAMGTVNKTPQSYKPRLSIARLFKRLKAMKALIGLGTDPVITMKKTYKFLKNTLLLKPFLAII